MESKLSKRKQFFYNPTIDPNTHQSIEINSDKYKQLVKKYGEPTKIKSPKSNKLISIGKGEYNKLKSDGYTDNQLIIKNDITPKLINVGGKEYTEDDLLMMIEHYYKTTTPLQELPTLVPDILKEIMYYADLKTLKHYCQTSKETQLLCRDSDFWKIKFEKQNLPFLYTIHEENIKITKNKNYKREPKTEEKWEKLYKDTVLNLRIATKLINNIIDSHKFMTFTHGEIAFFECPWFPVAWFKAIQTIKNNKDINRYYFRPEVIYSINITKNNIEYIIRFNIDWDLEEEDDFIKENYFNEQDKKYTLVLSQQEFIIYIAKLLYQFDQFDKEDVFLSEYFENDEDEDEEGNIIYRQDLKIKPTQNIKSIFPNW